MSEKIFVSQKTLKSPFKSHVVSEMRKGLSEKEARKRVGQRIGLTNTVDGNGKKNQSWTDLRGVVNSFRETQKAREIAEKNSLIDPLTGLGSRRSLLREDGGTGELQRKFSEALRYKHNLTVAMIDIDHFKKVNLPLVV